MHSSFLSSWSLTKTRILLVHGTPSARGEKRRPMCLTSAGGMTSDCCLKESSEGESVSRKNSAGCAYEFVSATCGGYEFVSEMAQR